MLSRRSTREVLEDHLRLAQAGELEEDLRRNYAPDVVLLCRSGVLQGLEGARASREELRRELPQARFDYLAVLTYGEVGFLEWRAEGSGVRVDDGADSYLIQDGRIQVQTIHYTVKPNPGA
ncbi:MAG TPA: nuclear transport factor 2 family protein [Meiothermus sp.]|jgi:hypothetical protein|nr:nuclear transport factor 2 family protein [Meiothermus sp.]